MPSMKYLFFVMRLINILMIGSWFLIEFVMIACTVEYWLVPLSLPYNFFEFNDIDLLVTVVTFIAGVGISSAIFLNQTFVPRL